jgi:hypothetical protein
MDWDGPSCPAAALKAALHGLQLCGGRVLLLSSSHSSIGFGALDFPRESLPGYGSVKEFSSYCGPEALLSLAETQPELLPLSSSLGDAEKELVKARIKAAAQEYLSLAADCCAAQVCVSAVMCASPDLPEFCDTAMLGHVSQATGGRLSLFTGPLLPEGGDGSLRLALQLQGELLRVAGSEAVVKLRTGTSFSLPLPSLPPFTPFPSLSLPSLSSLSPVPSPSLIPHPYPDLT